jgi:hypothetical protein
VLNVRGGINIGWVGATSPLASLQVDSESLTVKVLFIGSYVFRRNQIVRLTEHRSFPWLSSGIRIEHTHPDYPRKITFWPNGAPAQLLSRIQTEGFTPEAQPPTTRDTRGVPFRWITVIALALFWNSFFFLRLFTDGFEVRKHSVPGVEHFTVIGILFAASALVRWVKPARWLILKNGRSFDEIKHWVNLVILVFGMMLPMMVLIHFVHESAPR